MGAKYELENEEDLKDKLDFVKPVEAAPMLGERVTVVNDPVLGPIGRHVWVCSFLCSMISTVVLGRLTNSSI